MVVPICYLLLRVVPEVAANDSKHEKEFQVIYNHVDFINLHSVTLTPSIYEILHLSAGAMNLTVPNSHA